MNKKKKTQHTTKGKKYIHERQRIIEIPKDTIRRQTDKETHPPSHEQARRRDEDPRPSPQTNL